MSICKSSRKNKTKKQEILLSSGDCVSSMLAGLFSVAEMLNVKINLYLADNVSRQVKKAEGVSFVPRVQHTQEMGDVICTFPSTCQLKVLHGQK